MGLSGRVDFRTEFVVRFNYGEMVPWISRLDDGPSTPYPALTAWCCAVPLNFTARTIKTGRVYGEGGSACSFLLSYGPYMKARRRQSILSKPWSARRDFGGNGAPLSRCWSLDRSRQTFAHHLEGFDLRPVWRDRGRGHDLPSRAAGRREELGLPLLLASGRHLHAPGFHEPRLLRRGAVVAAMAPSGRRRQPAPSPDHVWGGRGAVAPGTDRSLAARL